MKKLILALTCLFFVISCWARVIIVDDNGPADFNNIQAAIDDANNGDVVEVQPGIYYENIRVKNGVTVEGSGADVTTINGGGNGHVVVFNLASGTISGFTITNSGSSPGYAAGIFVSQSTVTIQNNVIINNHYGITLSSGSNGTLTGNRIISCTGHAAIDVESSNPTIINNLVAGNSWTGIYCCQSSPSIINNTITHNSSFGILCNPDGTQVIANNIITQNKFGIFAGGGIASVVPLLHISYNNVWNNYEANYWEEYGIITPDGGWVVSRPFTPQPGTGEISQYPLFANPNNNDYHLQSAAGRWDPNSGNWVIDANTSPCIDAGDPNSDCSQEPCPNGGRINMGAYGGTNQASKSLGCFPIDHPHYARWVEVGCPPCWCYPRQCHGDTDDTAEYIKGKGYYRVHFKDMGMLLAAWNVREPPLGPGIKWPDPKICADFDHGLPECIKGGLCYRVHYKDMAILLSYWNVREPPQGSGIPPDCLDVP